jgi:hypothetical protein
VFCITLKSNVLTKGAGRYAMAYENHWLAGFNFNVEEWDAERLHYETMAISVGGNAVLFSSDSRP